MKTGLSDVSGNKRHPYRRHHHKNKYMTVDINAFSCVRGWELFHLCQTMHLDVLTVWGIYPMSSWSMSIEITWPKMELTSVDVKNSWERSENSKRAQDNWETLARFQWAMTRPVGPLTWHVKFCPHNFLLPFFLHSFLFRMCDIAWQQAVVSERDKKLITSFCFLTTQLIWMILAYSDCSLFLEEIASAQLLLSTSVRKRSTHWCFFSCSMTITFKNYFFVSDGAKKRFVK